VHIQFSFYLLRVSYTDAILHLLGATADTIKRSLVRLCCWAERNGCLFEMHYNSQAGELCLFLEGKSNALFVFFAKGESIIPVQTKASECEIYRNRLRKNFNVRGRASNDRSRAQRNRACVNVVERSLDRLHKRSAHSRTCFMSCGSCLAVDNLWISC